MQKREYLDSLYSAYNQNKISDEAYDAAIQNTAIFCDDFEDAVEEDNYSSSTAGDYSPSCPWNAPGMSIRDFI